MKKQTVDFKTSDFIKICEQLEEVEKKKAEHIAVAFDDMGRKDIGDYIRGKGLPKYAYMRSDIYTEMKDVLSNFCTVVLNDIVNEKTIIFDWENPYDVSRTVAQLFSEESKHESRIKILSWR